MRKFSAKVTATLTSLILCSMLASSARAYYVGMPADLVVGQQNFTSSSIDQGGSAGANTLDRPYHASIYQEKFIISDYGNSRVVIFNQLPTQNNPSANVVVGQPNFTTTSFGTTDSKLNFPTMALVADGKLIVSDLGNQRVLIYNQVPTTNGAAADVVIGQTNFTTKLANQGGAVGANTVNLPTSVLYHDGKLLISDRNNHRVLIFNQIPTTSNASADVVIGQPNLTSNSANQGGSPAANTLNAPAVINVIDGRLYISEAGNDRILVYNQIPTTNNAAADQVIGQPNLTSNGENQGGTPNASTLSDPSGVSTDGKRLFVADDANHRLLIWNAIPSGNNPAADVVLGQQNFTSVTANQGGAVSASTLHYPINPLNYQGKLIVPDFLNSRVLFFSNITRPVSLQISNVPEQLSDGKVKMSGVATTQSPYFVQKILVSVNGQGFFEARPTDGLFESENEQFYAEFDLSDYIVKDGQGNIIDGYTVEFKLIDSNGEEIDSLFFFSPFVLHDPIDDQVKNTDYPEFSFSVNKQRERLRDHLQEYQVWISQLDEDGDYNWQALVTGIPVDFESVKGSVENLQKEQWQNVDTKNGVYETADFVATYSDESSRVSVRSKTTSVQGRQLWKVVAVDKVGHTLEAGIRQLYGTHSEGFPLAILSLTGVGDPSINTYQPELVKSSYTTNVSNPTFYGIAADSSKVTVEIADSDCLLNQKKDCSKFFTTTANAESRFGVNLPANTLASGNIYKVRVWAIKDDEYVITPDFALLYAVDETETSFAQRIQSIFWWLPLVRWLH